MGGLGSSIPKQIKMARAPQHRFDWRLICREKDDKSVERHVLTSGSVVYDMLIVANNVC